MKAFLEDELQAIAGTYSVFGVEYHFDPEGYCHCVYGYRSSEDHLSGLGDCLCSMESQEEAWQMVLVLNRLRMDVLCPMLCQRAGDSHG